MMGHVYHNWYSFIWQTRAFDIPSVGDSKSYNWYCFPFAEQDQGSPTCITFIFWVSLLPKVNSINHCSLSQDTFAARKHFCLCNPWSVTCLDLQASIRMHSILICVSSISYLPHAIPIYSRGWRLLFLYTLAHYVTSDIKEIGHPHWQINHSKSWLNDSKIVDYVRFRMYVSVFIYLLILLLCLLDQPRNTFCYSI